MSVSAVDCLSLCAGVSSSRLLVVEISSVTVCCGLRPILGSNNRSVCYSLRSEHIVVTAAVEALDSRLEAVKFSAKRELTDCPQNFDVFWVIITTLKLFLLFLRGIKWPSSWMLEAMFVTVTAELSIHIFKAVVTVVLYRFGLVWSIDQDSGRELYLDVSRVIFKNAF